MRPIITSILDNDFYKFTTLDSILKLQPGQQVEYKLHNRDNRVFPEGFAKVLQQNIEGMAELYLTQVEEIYLRKEFSETFDEEFINYLKDFRYNPKQVSIREMDGSLILNIKGTWEQTILWEVPLLALISELYFEKIAKSISLDKFKSSTYKKGVILRENKINYIEFGTRRRFSKLTQSLAVSLLKMSSRKNLLGTTNVYLGMVHNIPVKDVLTYKDPLTFTEIVLKHRVDQETVLYTNDLEEIKPLDIIIKKEEIKI